MRPQRLSYETAGAAVQARGEAPVAARAPSLAVVAPPAVAAPGYGRSPGQARRRRVVVATMLAVHALAVVGLLDASRLRDAVADAKPIFLAVVDAPAPVAPSKPLPPPPTTKIPPQPQLTLPLIAPEVAPSPSPLVAQVLPPPPPAPAAPVEAPPAPAPSLLPRTIPPSAVQYLVPLAPVYPRASVKMRESGKALVRVLIDEAGLPRTVQLATSSGFGRLDDAALAAVRNARFKPYLENGVAVQAWAVIPLEFELPT
jgi:protein TonB